MAIAGKTDGLLRTFIGAWTVIVPIEQVALEIVAHCQEILLNIGRIDGRSGLGGKEGKFQAIYMFPDAVLWLAIFCSSRQSSGGVFPNVRHDKVHVKFLKPSDRRPIQCRMHLSWK